MAGSPCSARRYTFLLPRFSTDVIEEVVALWIAAVYVTFSKRGEIANKAFLKLEVNGSIEINASQMFLKDRVFMLGSRLSGVGCIAAP